MARSDDGTREGSRKDRARENRVPPSLAFILLELDTWFGVLKMSRGDGRIQSSAMVFRRKMKGGRGSVVEESSFETGREEEGKVALKRDEGNLFLHSERG